MPLPQQNDDAVVLRDLALGYGGKPVLERISGRIPAGALLALVGPNGAGKSTLLKALAGLLRPTAGSIAGLRTCRSTAYMPQHTELDRTFPIGVRAFVAMGLWRETGWWRPLSSLQKARTEAALAGVGLADHGDRRLGTLSGGQMRRVLFARASLQDASFILLDEPFAGIDSATAEDLLGTIRGWHDEGRTVIAAMHDLNRVRVHFPETLLLARQVIGWGASDAILTDANLAAARAACALEATRPDDAIDG